MSINHYKYSSELPEGQWSPYMMESPTPSKTTSSSPHHQYLNSHTHLISSHFTTPTTSSSAPSAMFCPPNTAFSFNLNNDNAQEELVKDNTTTKEVQPSLQQVQDESEIPKEPLFEKPLTPSDVGKLNRLVIPKQHAEKYFPLTGGDSGENGLLLCFEDEVGKSWRFRYSYWNSSQSYVLTKGWSRYVKEKRLGVGDAVVFTRHRLDGGRLFIGWRRRNSPADSFGGGDGWGRTAVDYYSQRRRLDDYQKVQYTSPLIQPPYQPEYLYTGSVLKQNQTATGDNNKNNNSKRLRLFGVNLDFPADESEPSTPEDLPMSQSHPFLDHYYSTHHNYMDINFSGGGDAYQQG